MQDKIELAISVNSGNSEAEIKRINVALDGIGRSSQNAGSGADRLSDALARIGHYGVGGAGLFAVANSASVAAKAMFESSAAAERLRTQLSFSAGDAAKELGYLSNLANRMGLEFRSTAHAYSGFAAAARGTALEGQKTRDVFEAISKASAVMGLSADQSSGALLAIQQMMSKGVVSAEEFRGQLGERMPIALQAGAKALGVTAAEFSKLMESGKIVSDDFLPKFAAAITEMLGDAPEKAANRLDASVNRMLNAWDKLKQAGGDAGVSKALAADMNAMTSTANAMAEAIEQAAKRGEGGLGKLASAAGVLLGRAAFGGLASVAEAVNGSLNLLSGGALKLSTNISLLPDNLRPAVEQLAAVEGKIKGAQVEYEALAQRVAKAPENIYLKSELAQLGLYISRLKQAREQQSLLIGQALPENYGNEGRGAAQAKAADDAAAAAAQKRAKAYAEMFDKLATPAEKASKAIREARESLGEFFTPEIERRLRDSFDKKEGAGAAKNDATETFAARLKEEQDYAKTAVEIIQEKVKQQVLSEREGIEQTLAAQQAGVVAQAKLLKAQLAGTSDGGQREKIKAQIVALGNDAAVAAEKAASGFAKIDQAATAAWQKIVAGMADETNALLLKAKAAEEENATIGLSADRLAELTRHRYDERIAILQTQAAAVEGNAEREAERYLIEQQISALQRLRDAEIVRPKLREQAREWERFADDINRSLTDALFRAFESGNGFGKSFAETLGNTIKAALAKALIQATITTGSNALNGVINSLAGTSGANNGAGTNYLGLANNASSLYNLYAGGQAAYTAYTGTGALSSSEAGAAAWQYLQGGDWGTALGVYLKGLTGTSTTATTGAAAGSTTASTGAMGLSSALGYMAAIAVAFNLLTESKTRYLNTQIKGTLGPNGLTNGMIGDEYKATGNLLNAGGRELEWRPLTGDQATYDEFYMGMRYGNYRNNPEALQSAGYLGDNIDSYTLQRIPYTQAQIDDAFARYMADQDALDIRINRTGSGQTVAEELTQGAALKAAFEAIYKGAKDSLQKTADLFGDQSLGATLQNYVSEINIQTSGSIADAIGKYADGLIQGMGAAWLPTVESLRATTEVEGKKITETWTQTFQRLVTESAAVKDVFDLVGESLASLYGNNTDKILAASDAFVKLFGSIDAMTNSVNAYYENFYTAAEKTARGWEIIGKQFDALGVSTPRTREAFRALVEAQDLSTLAGQKTFKSLMDLQGAFSSLVPTIEQTVSSLRGETDTAYQALERAVSKQRESYELALDVAEAQADGLKTLLGIITGAVDDLQQDAAGRSAQGRQFIADALSAAQTSGYLPDPDQLSKAIADARYGMDGTVYASETDRQRDRLIIAGQLSQLGDVGKKQMTVAEQQVAAAKASIKSLDDLLDSYQDQIDAIRDVNGGVKSVEQAIKDMQAALTKEIQTATQILVSSLLSNLQAGMVRPTEVKKELEKKGVTLNPDAWNKVQTAGGPADVYQSSGGAIGYKETLYGTNGTNVTFADAISNVNAALGAGNPMLVYTSARDMGVSANSLDALMGWAPGTSNAWADDNKLPRFARGGFYGGGMALVGEEGPEIINFRAPGQVYNASQTRDALGVKALEERVETLIGLMIEANRNSRRTADAVNGAPEAPILVTTV